MAVADGDSSPTPAVSPGQPTSIRYGIVAVTFLAAFVLYLHRFCMTYVQRYIKEDLGLDNSQIALCFTAFFLAYALAQVPAGWLSDRYGARLALTAYIITWSLFTGLMGLTVGFLMLFAIRVAAGLGQAGAYPTSAGLVSKWVPFTARGKASSAVAIGGRLGGGLAPLLTVSLVVVFSARSSPQIGSDDLLDVYLLCHRLVASHELTQARPDSADDGEATPRIIAADDQLRSRVFAQLSPAEQQSVLQLASGYRFAWHPQRDAEGAAQPRTGRPPASRQLGLTRPSGETVAGLAEQCNALLYQSEWCDDSLVRNIAVEREARDLIMQTTEDSGKPDSPGTSARVHRFVLEALFPNSLRKLYVDGWRPVMGVFGAFGLVVAVVFWIVVRDRPALHPGCNASEQAVIAAGRPAAQTSGGKTVRAVPIKQILKSRSLWLMCVSQWGGNVGWVFLVTWLPRYLFEVHSVPLLTRGWMAAIPLWVGWAGMLLGGWLTDRWVRRWGLRWRVGPIVCGRMLGMCAYLLCLLQPSAWAITALFAVVAFSADLSNPSSWAYKMDVGGQYVASIHGWANMWGNLGAAVSPLLLQLVVSGVGWNAAFLTCAGAFGLSATAVFFVDARIPVVPDEPQ